MEKNNTNVKLITVLNELVKVNNDRVTHYGKAKKEIHASDIDLQDILSQFIKQSKKNLAELSSVIHNMGGNIADDTTFEGKLYRMLIDVKSVFTGKDKHAILESSDHVEKVVQKIYSKVLPEIPRDDAGTYMLVAQQKEELAAVHRLLEKYRNINKLSP